jgi:hypothetical protein
VRERVRFTRVDTLIYAALHYSPVYAPRAWKSGRMLQITAFLSLFAVRSKLPTGVSTLPVVNTLR